MNSSFKKEIFSVVICFHPEYDSVVRNLDSYIDKVDKIIVYCNSADVRPILQAYPQYDRLCLIGEGTNVGIAKAINEGIKWGFERGYKYVMTMDQDSSWVDIDSYFEYIRKETDQQITLFAPMIKSVDGRDNVVRDGFMIQSGSVYKMSMFVETGLFSVEYFIDNVDFEMLFRAQRYGYRLASEHAGLLLHNLGYRKRITGTKYYSEYYSPLRLYYINRNAFWIWKDFRHPFFRKSVVFKSNYYRIKHIVIGEDDKRKKIFSILKGIFDGLFTKPSEWSVERLD